MTSSIVDIGVSRMKVEDELVRAFSSICGDDESGTQIHSSGIDGFDGDTVGDGASRRRHTGSPQCASRSIDCDSNS